MTAITLVSTQICSCSLDDSVGFFTSVNGDGVGSILAAGSYLRVALFHQFMDRYFPPPPFPEEPTLATAKEHARQVAGEYEMSRRPSGTFWRALYLAARVAIKGEQRRHHRNASVDKFQWDRSAEVA